MFTLEFSINSGERLQLVQHFDVQVDRIQIADPSTPLTTIIVIIALMVIIIIIVGKTILTSLTPLHYILLPSEHGYSLCQEEWQMVLSEQHQALYQPRHEGKVST